MVSYIKSICRRLFGQVKSQSWKNWVQGQNKNEIMFKKIQTRLRGQDQVTGDLNSKTFIMEIENQQ